MARLIKLDLGGIEHSNGVPMDKGADQLAVLHQCGSVELADNPLAGDLPAEVAPEIAMEATPALSMV